MAGAGRLSILASDDKDRANIVTFLDEVAVLFCPEDVSFDLLFDERGYLFLDAALTVVTDITMEIEESYEGFGSCLGLAVGQNCLDRFHVPW